MNLSQLSRAGWFLALLASATLARGEAIFEVIADVATSAPGRVDAGVFRRVAEPQLDGDRVVFFGQDQLTSGFFESAGGVLARIVDADTITPGGNAPVGGFSGSNRASASGGRTAILDRNQSGGVGILLAANGQLGAIAQNGDPVPGSNGRSFVSFATPQQSGARTVFTGSFGTNRQGIFASEGAGLTSVITSEDQRPVPGFMNRSFSNFFVTDLQGDQLLFAGGGFRSIDGVYQASLSGQIGAIVDVNTPIPDGVGTFVSLDARFPRLDGDRVVFVGNGSNAQSGIYLAEGGVLSTVVDRNTIQPGGTNAFSDLRNPAVEGDSVFFVGSGQLGVAVYQSQNGILTEVIREGDLIDGRPFERIFGDTLSVDGNRLAFAAVVGGRQTIVRATLVPEPAGVSLAIASFGLLGSVRRRSLRLG